MSRYTAGDHPAGHMVKETDGGEWVIWHRSDRVMTFPRAISKQQVIDVANALDHAMSHGFVCGKEYARKTMREALGVKDA